MFVLDSLYVMVWGTSRRSLSWCLFGRIHYLINNAILRLYELDAELLKSRFYSGCYTGLL